MKYNLEKISGVPLFEGFSSEELLSVLERLGAAEKDFTKGDAVITEGCDAVFFGIVLEGSVSIVRNDWFGNRNIMLTVVAPSMFGEAIACTGLKKYSVSIFADGDVRILMIPGRNMFAQCRLEGEVKDRLYLNMMKVMARKNLMFRQKIDTLSQRSTREKLLHYLNAQARAKESRTFEIPYDRQELADYLGVERSALSAVISGLRDDGIIESRKNSFTLLDTGS